MYRMDKVNISLMYLGLIPFFGTAFITGFHLPITSILDINIQTFARSYSLVIGSFMSGIYWGQALMHEPAVSRKYALISNILCLGFWFSFLIFGDVIFYFSNILLFTCLLIVDFKMKEMNFMTHQYFMHRGLVSSGVILCLLILSLS